MKESYTEGIANHGDPESCVCTSDGAHEALTGARTGWVLSLENAEELGADAVKRSGRQHLLCRNCERRQDSTWSQTQRGAAPGVDMQTWSSYGENLQRNLNDLSERLKQGAYRAKAVRRTYIPKPDGKQRPLGVTAIEDKIVQRATVEVLNAVYEADFLGFSYGFRPGRSQHNALDAVYAAIMTRKVNWVFDADIRDFFSTINHEWMVKFIEHRIADKRVVRLIRKWLTAGVLEDGKVVRNEVGLPQGGSASPTLANVYLHYVYDLWIQWW